MKTQTHRTRLPRAIWALGLVSLFMDVSSEMIHALLPVFLVSSLGASMIVVGAIEGLGEAVAATVKLFSGWLSDRLRHRKILVLAGYTLGALSKPLFALAPNAALVLGARLIDRVGKGLRGAPRDAMIGDLAPASMRGAAYGLRQALDTAGAFAGPALGIALMALLADNFRAVFGLATIPGLIAVVILLVGVREPARKAAFAAPAKLVSREEVRALGAPYWRIVGVAVVIMMARFSAAFLVLRAVDKGLPVAWSPLVFMVINAIYAASAYPVGVLSDRIGRSGLLAGSFAVLVCADLVLALAPGLGMVLAGAALWGLHLGLSEGLLASLVADSAPPALRGAAFGIFHFLGGMAALAASLAAGALWQWAGPAASFYTSAALAATGLAGYFVFVRRDAA